MTLSRGNTIYQQIADFGIDQLLNGSWVAGEKIPSVRSLAIDVGVTPNTILRAYRDLEDLGIIQTRRGMGFFVAEGGRQTAIDLRRREFLEQVLPQLRRTMELLSISPEEMLALLRDDAFAGPPQPPTTNPNDQ